MNNKYLLKNEIISKILISEVEKSKVEIYVQKCNDINLLLKLNDELLNINNNCELIFYSDEFDENIDSSLKIFKSESVNVDNISNFSFDFIISDLAFNENENILKNLLNYNYSKLILTVSSSYFDENNEFLESLQNNSYFKSIISLPIYEDYSNLLILDFDSNKTNYDILIIDESDSIIHKDINDWSLITEDLSKKISDSYENFCEYENALIIPISKVIRQKSLFGDDFEKFIKSDPLMELSKKRVVENKVVDDILNYKNQLIDLKMDKNPNFSFKDLIYGKKRQDLENLLYKNNEKIIDEEVKFKKLGDLVNLKQINKKNQKDTLLIATCKDCTEQMVFNNFDVDEFDEDEIYIEVNVISKEITPQYLQVYLNSTNGLNEIFYFAKGDLYITAEKIQNVNVPIPPKNIQNEIVKASQEANEFFRSIDLLKKEFQSNILDYNNIINSINDFKGSMDVNEDEGIIEYMPRHWWHVYKGLIWPFAISYLVATRGKTKGVGKLDNYLFMFEFIAAFNFIVLLSALPDNVYQKYKYKIWNKLSEYKKMSFGNWIILTKNIIDKVYEKNDFTSVLDENLINMITSDKILKILNYASYIRNEKFHGSFMVDEEADEIIEELDVYLEDIFNILEVYSDYDLIYCPGHVEKENNKYNFDIILLNGPFQQPVYDNLILDEDLLKEKSLYLYNPKNNKFLELDDNLMKFSPIDKYKKHWGLFIYRKWEEKDYKTKAYYKCFQSREEDISVEIVSFKNNIIG